jgi:hypothetical protein
MYHSRLSSHGRALCDDLWNLALGDRPISPHNFIAGQLWFFAETRGLSTQEDVIHRDDAHKVFLLRDDRKPAHAPFFHGLQRYMNIIFRGKKTPSAT